ncbi:MAG: sulfite exporter TauE/SafE family protein [Siphonobacter sp.]
MYFLAFVTGLTASLHCVGMCGPIALALPVAGLSEGRILAARLLYNLTRTLSYGLLGLLVGFIGERLSLFGWQQQLSWVSGLLMLVFWARHYISIPHRFLRPGHSLGKLLQTKTWWAYAGVGFLNGWLPCGMIYVALAGALSAATPTASFLFMICYGLGTLPAMLAIGWIWRWVNLSVRRQVNRWIPVFTLALALFFIWRGLGLGLPLSPKPALPPGTAPVCHSIK